MTGEVARDLLGREVRAAIRSRKQADCHPEAGSLQRTVDQSRMKRHASPGPESLGKALAELVALRGLARPRGTQQLAEIWKTVAGPRIAAATRVIGIRRGVLHVGVASSPLLSELASFHKESLLAAFERDHADLKIRDLKFRLNGEIS